MSESDTHQKLVLRLIKYVSEIVGLEFKCFIQADICTGFELPSQMDEGFRPDVYFEHNNVLIIGEAKTDDDVSRQHSVEQYRSYLRTCQQYHGRAIYVMTVPYISYAEASLKLRGSG